MAKTLSLIVPFYNEYAYLADCLDSVRAQGLGDRVEVIVVNDNPGDRNNGFVEEMAARYGARFVHHAVNRGLSAARNTGMEAATGDLTTFLDSDDYYTADGLARHLAFAEAEDAEIAHTPTVVKTLRGEVQYVDWDGKLFLTRRGATDIHRFPAAQFIASSWSSIYRTGYLRRLNLRFDEEQRRFEDRLFVLEAVIPAERIAFAGDGIGGPVRVYRRRPGSITTAGKQDDDRLLQAKLSRKCVDIVARAVKDRRLTRAHLQREVMICLQRMVMNTAVADASLEETEDLAEARAIFSSIFAEHPVAAATYGDKTIL
ncbi:MAG: glycosyltransferase family 2 protein, partial [Pseudomonadota bacterium]